VAVIGGGIAGLAAAWELTGGADGDADAPTVVVLEAAARPGGKLATGLLDGGPIDLGPDGFLARRPEATDLCREVGLGDELVPIGASGAAVWARGRLRPFPAGLALGVPTRFWPAARSGILGPGGSLRLLRDVLSPRPDLRGPVGDRAIGPLVARKLGPRVVDNLVDPLVGGIHAGSVADMSSAAVYPMLLAVAQNRGSFMRALRRAQQLQEATASPGGTVGPRPDNDDGADADADDAPREDGAGGHTDLDRAPGPAFWALRAGMGSLVDRLVDRLTARGVLIRTGAPVELLDRAGAGGPPWVLHTAEGPIVADGVVVATPAPAAAGLLENHDEDAATLLRAIDHAGVTLVSLLFDAAAAPDHLYGTGLLVPRSSPPLPGHDDAPLITACTYLSQKWPHLARPGSVLVRASVGRFGDDRGDQLDDAAMTERVAAEVAAITGIGAGGIGASGGHAAPRQSIVSRWPDSFPQYRVHHLLRVAGIEAAVRRLPALAVAGAAYRGVGIPACVASGRTAARTVMDALDARPGGAGPTG
jgi:oxygen-dependent protoporphyrinogen oxidase